MLQQHFEKEAARFAAFDEEDDMFADDTKNKPEQASTSAPVALPSLLSTPRASFTFPEVWADSNSGTPRLHPAGTSHSQLQPQDSQPQLQDGHSELQNGLPQLQNTASNGNAASSSAAEAESNGHARGPTAAPAAEASAAQVDYHSWPVKELRRFLVEKGVVSVESVDYSSPSCCMFCAFLLLLLLLAHGLRWACLLQTLTEPQILPVSALACSLLPMPDELSLVSD